KSNHWHNNLISCEADASRGIGIYDLSWDKGDANEPDPAYVYNNILVGCGDGWNGAIYHANGHAVIYNNTIVNNQGVGIQLHDKSPVLSSAALNNVIISTGDEYVQRSERHLFSNNSYFGGPANSVPSSDTNAIVADPMIAVNSTAYNPVIIDKNSPLIGAGLLIKSMSVGMDFYGTVREGKYSIGAVSSANATSPDPVIPLIAQPIDKWVVAYNKGRISRPVKMLIDNQLIDPVTPRVEVNAECSGESVKTTRSGQWMLVRDGLYALCRKR
ncbi:MAG: hypothetical protein L3J89_05425, partial [Gammaproteobacteria bacterium]|nr:hypothetical protein [Gammaproteobacteria bacterium]